MQSKGRLTRAPGKSCPRVIVVENLFNAGEPSSCFASSGRLVKSIYLASPRVLDIAGLEGSMVSCQLYCSYAQRATMQNHILIQNKKKKIGAIYQKKKSEYKRPLYYYDCHRNSSHPSLLRCGEEGIIRPLLFVHRSGDRDWSIGLGLGIVLDGATFSFSGNVFISLRC